MARIRRPDTAFSLDPSGKHTKPMRDPKHLAFIRTLPCIITGKLGVEACHIRMSSAAHGKPTTGKAQKPSDSFVVPMTPEQHRKQHSGSEAAFWAATGIDPCEAALALYGVTGDTDEARKVLALHRSKVSA